MVRFNREREIANYVGDWAIHAKPGEAGHCAIGKKMDQRGEDKRSYSQHQYKCWEDSPDARKQIILSL